MVVDSGKPFRYQAIWLRISKTDSFRILFLVGILSVLEPYLLFRQELGRVFLLRYRSKLLKFFYYPRITEGGTAYHYGVTMGFSKHFLGTFNICYIAIADYGNIYGFFYFFYYAPIGIAFIALTSCTGMDCYGRGSGFFYYFCYFDSIYIVAVPSTSYFNSYGNGNRRYNGFDYFLY